MTSTSSPTYPAEYYYPEFIESRSDDPRISPPAHPPLSTSVTTTTNLKQLTNGKKKSTKNLAIDVVTNQGLPDVDITESVKIDPKKSLIRDPVERNIPKLIVDDNIIKQSIFSSAIPITNLDNNENIQSNKILHGHTNKELSKKTKPIESIKNQQQHQIMKTEQPIDEYWKKEILIDDKGVVAIEPIEYDKNIYEGPFGLTRKGSFIFYIGMSIFTLVAAIFLILTGVFYGQNYPDSSANTGKLAGMGICALSFYLGLQLILIGLWHQKYRQENPIKKVKKTSTVRNESIDHLKSSMKDNEQYDYSYQQPIDYALYGCYSNPPYVPNINEQMLLQQPGAATGARYYDSVVWPSNVEIQTQPDAKFLQPMEWSSGPLQKSIVNTTSLTEIDTSMSNKMEKTEHKPAKPVEAQPAVTGFDNLHLNSNVIEQPLPALPKAPETMELIQSIAQMEQPTKKSPPNSDVSHQIKSVDSKTDLSSSNEHRTNHKHHHHHRHRPRHHHKHHRHLSSPCSQCTYYSHEYHRDHTFDHHYHHSRSGPPPRIITPRLPKILTPSLPKISAAIYRETGINTGTETKIMRDSSATADLEDVSYPVDNRLGQVPVVRRTIIVEPYPAQPSSKIVVKPRVDMTGKIRLGKNTKLRGDDETIVYPSTAFLIKESKKKKKSTIIQNDISEDLQLEDINDDDQSIKIQTLTRQTIKNAFYN